MRLRLAVRILAPIAALIVTGGACVGRDGAPSGGFRAEEVVGAVTVRSAETGPRELRNGDDVPAGSVVRTGTDGFVRMTGGGHAVELQGGTQLRIDGGGQVSLEMGRVLGIAGPERPLGLDSRGVSVRAARSASVRLERLLGALRVAVYAGTARVELVGRGVDVPALREVVIAGAVPLERAPRPLTLSGADRWDKKLLGDVLTFDQDVSQFGRGFDAEFSGRAVAPEFFTPFVAIPNLSFVRTRIQTSEPSEVLVGLVFAAQLAARNLTATVSRSFTEVLALRDQGASWGLIAKEKGLSLVPLRAAVLDAIRRGTTPAPPPGASNGGSGGGGSGGGGSNGGGGGSTPSPRSSPRPNPSPSPSPNPTPPDEECSLVERLLGQCNGQPAGGEESQQASSCSVLGVLLDPDC